MLEKLKAAGLFIFGIAFAIAIGILIFLLFWGGLSIADKIFPFFLKATNILTSIALFILIPLHFSKRQGRGQAVVYFYFLIFLV